MRRTFRPNNKPSPIGAINLDTTSSSDNTGIINQEQLQNNKQNKYTGFGAGFLLLGVAAISAGIIYANKKD